MGMFGFNSGCSECEERKMKEDMEFDAKQRELLFKKMVVGDQKDNNIYVLYRIKGYGYK